MMTAREMLPAIGQTVSVRFEGTKEPMFVDCRVVNVKYSYGKPRLRVEPLRGHTDEYWIEMSRVRLIDSGLGTRPNQLTKGA